MTDPLDLAGLRSVAVGVAYRMLGSRTEAEDLAQDAVERVRAVAATETLHTPEAFVTTVVTRLAIDHLRLARVTRETYLGPWLPEPVTDDPIHDPARSAELADSLSFALLVVLESLHPTERAAFLLHDVFGYGYPDLATTLDRSEAACRQLVSRARRHIAQGRQIAQADPVTHRRLLERFLAAARTGDLDRLVALLAEDAVLVSDGGPHRRAARRPITGQDRVARFLRRVGPNVLTVGPIESVSLNGEPGFVVHSAGGDRPYLAGTIEADGDRIRAVRWVLNPDKLRWLALSSSPQ
ncbi:MAG: RNA polymerase sigma factor SigJ [Acidimicrobiales bacterium]